MCKQKFILFFGIILITLSFACTVYVDKQQKARFSDISNAYRKAILWSDFDYASSFLKSDLQKQYQTDPIYQNIKVTAYNEKQVVVSSDLNKIEQTVHIQYYWLNRMVEKTIVEHLVWEWDTNAKNWYLTSGLPMFE